MKVLVTGACGYIGAHTVVDLVENDIEPISIDNFSRSSPQMLQNIDRILQKPLINHIIDLCDSQKMRQFFEKTPNIDGIIHFAAYKSVPESVAKPLSYYHNNIVALINLLECTRDYGIPAFVFSSSCSVYGNAPQLPVDEQTPIEKAQSPYAYTKQIGEQMVSDFARIHTQTRCVSLRYFNPAGAHPSTQIGEVQEQAQNLVPYITQTAIGKRPFLTIFGNDYDTPDGTCIRDYVHVSDIAHAHTLALQYIAQSKNPINNEIFNLGSGTGSSVLEAITAFEKVSGKKLNYHFGPRREGDVAAVYANKQKAQQFLAWNPQFSLEDIMRTAWIWEQKMAMI